MLADDTCAYRSPDGKKCAVGILIKDEFYGPDLEGALVSSGCVLDALCMSGIPNDEAINLSRRFQP